MIGNSKSGAIALIFAMMISSIVAGTLQMNPISALGAAADSETLSKSNKPITRSFSFHTVEFLGKPAGNLTIFGKWYPNGTVAFFDVRGHQYVLQSPGSDGSFSIYQNSSVIDQRFTSNGLNYDIFWKATADSEGFSDKLKFEIVGTSEKPTTLSFKVKSPNFESLLVQQNRLVVSNSVIDSSGSNNNAIAEIRDFSFDTNIQNQFVGKTIINSPAGTNSTIPEGIGIDWSDAIAADTDVSFDKANGSIDFSVGTSFNIDPIIIATVSAVQTPGSGDYAEGEKRIVRVQYSTLAKEYAFYYDGTSIWYQVSKNDGNSWGSATSIGTGVINTDYYRWAVIQTNVSGSDYVTLLYYKQSGTNTNFYAKRGTIPSGTSTTITWAGEQLIFTASNYGPCSGGTCAAVVASTDTSGNIYAAFRYIDATGVYYYRINKSTDGGLTWPSSGTGILGPTSASGYRIEMFLTKLASGRMLFGFSTYDTGAIMYRIFDGSSWLSANTLSASTTGMPANSIKHISSDSDNSQTAYAAYLTNGNSGNIKMATWSNTGSFTSTFDVTTGTSSYSLPHIIFNPVDNTARVFAIISPSLPGNSAIAEIVPATCSGCGTIKGTGDTGTSPYPDQLSTAVKYPAFLFIQPANTIKFNGHSLVPAPYSSGTGSPINSGGGGCSLGGSWCDFWDTTTGKMRNFDAPVAGNSLTTLVEINTASPPGNSPVFWRSTDGAVIWGFSYSAVGNLVTSKAADSATGEGGIEMWRCHTTSVDGTCDAPGYSIVRTIHGPAIWSVVGTNLNINDLNHFYAEQTSPVTQTGNYRYFAAPYSSASAHSCKNGDPGCPGDGAATANFGNSQTSANYFQVNYLYREMQ